MIASRQLLLRSGASLSAGLSRVGFNRSFSSLGVSHSVYSWGTGDQGQLGHPSVVKEGWLGSYVELKPKVIDALENKHIVSVSAGKTTAAATSATGELYTWGSLSGGKLGHQGGNATDPSNKYCLVPTKTSLFGDKIKAKQVICSENNTSVLSEEGYIYTCGGETGRFAGVGIVTEDAVPEGDSGFLKIRIGEDEDLKVKQIAAGKAHMLALGNGGEVWSWGKGENGRLGNNSNSAQTIPQPVETFLDLDLVIKKIVCGERSSFALTEDGKIYAWGGNEQGQLGMEAGFAADMFSMQLVPTLIESIEEKVVDISAGAHHTLAITESGKVYFWGMKIWMQPHEMTVLQEDKIVSCAAGDNFSVAINDAGMLFSWGKGFFNRLGGSLGQGHTKRVAQPELMDISAHETFQLVSCGHKFGLALTGLP